MVARAVDVALLLKRFVFSDLGLLCLVCGYCVGGAYLFQAIEYDNVQNIIVGISQQSFYVEQNRSWLADQIYMYKNEKDFNNTVDQMLLSYQVDVVAKTIQSSVSLYTGAPRTVSEIPNPWRFRDALLFTVETVTTIGYGQVVPILPLGQLVLIFYAIIGVPLNLAFLSSNGKVMAKKFRHIYNHGCCYICWKQRRATFTAKRRRLIWSLKYGKLKYTDLQDHSTKKLEEKMKAEKDIHLGEVSDAEAKKILHDDVDVWCQFVEIMEHIEEDKNVPISLVLIVIAAYLFLGSVIFSAWNGWSYIKSAYFCFVTLATIGFGDIIANTDRSGVAGDLQTILIYVYIYFGLSVISMSFNLMIVEMKSKVNSVLTALGLKDKKTPAERLSPEEQYEEERLREIEPPSHAETARSKSGLLQAPQKFQQHIE